MKKNILLPLLLALTQVGIGQNAKLTLPIGHTEKITSLAFSKDGKWLLSGSTDNTARLWEVSSAKEVRKFQEEDLDITAVGISPDNATAIVGYTFGLMRLFDIASGDPKDALPGHNSPIHRILFSNDGKYLFSLSEDGKGLLRETSAPQPTHAIEGISYFGFLPDNQHLFFIQGKQLSVMNIEIKEVIFSWQLPPEPLMAAAGIDFQDSPAILLFTPSEIILYNSINGKKIKAFPYEADWEAINHLSYDPDSKLVTATGYVGLANDQLLEEDSRINFMQWLLDAEKEKSAKSFLFQNINIAATSPDAALLVAGSLDKRRGEMRLASTLRGYEVSHGRSVSQFGGYGVFFQEEPALAPRITPDGANLTAVTRTASRGLSFKIFNFEKRQIQSIGISEKDDRPIPSPELDMLFFRQSELLLNIHTGDTLWYKKGNLGISAATFNPQTNFLICGSWDGSLQIIDPEKGQVWKERAFSGGVKGVITSRDGNRWIAWNNKREVKSWDLQNQLMGSHKMASEKEELKQVSFLGSEIVILSYTEKSGKLENISLSIWPGDLSSPRATWPIPALNVTDALLSPDGKKLVLKKVRKDETQLSEIAYSSWNTLSGEKEQAFILNNQEQVFGLSFNGKYLFSTSSSKDGIVLRTIEKGTREALMHFVGEQGWAVYNQSGQFDSSEDAMFLMHFTVGLEVVELEQLKERLYIPGLLPIKLGLSEGEIREQEQLNQTAIPIYPELDASITGNTLKIKLIPKEGGIGRVSIFFDESMIIRDANPQRKRDISIPLENLAEYFDPGSSNRIGIRAYNKSGWLKSRKYEIPYPSNLAQGRGGSPEENAIAEEQTINKEVQLFALVVGTADYAGEDIDLTLAGKDAVELARVLEKVAGDYFKPENVHVRLFSTEEGTERPSKEKIEAAIKEFKEQKGASPQDIILVYLSGHGLNFGLGENTSFYYLTPTFSSFKNNDEEYLKTYAISTDDLISWINQTTIRKKVLILDACFSGKMIDDLIGKKDISPDHRRSLEVTRDQSGMFILASSSPDQQSFEYAPFGMGLLTYSLLSGIDNPAVRDGAFIKINSLFQHSQGQVKELAQRINKKQEPVILGSSEFVIGKVDAPLDIKVYRKPIFTPSFFVNEANFQDDLGINSRTNYYMRQLKNFGLKAPLLYHPDPDTPESVRIGGPYTVENGNISVKARIYRGGEMIHEFESPINGKTDELDKLVGIMVKKAVQALK
jgi:WD40 repeat protein/uncharacterized caspase-like protein